MKHADQGMDSSARQDLQASVTDFSGRVYHPGHPHVRVTDIVLPSWWNDMGFSPYGLRVRLIEDVHHHTLG